MRVSATADDVVRALDEFSAAEIAVERATLAELGLGANDARVLRHLLETGPGQPPATPRMLADLLGVSSAAMTSLLDRLAEAGWICRSPHPADRRSIVVTATVAPGSPVRRLLSVRRVAVGYAAAKLSAVERRTVVDFLDGLAHAEEHYLDEAGSAASTSA